MEAGRARMSDRTKRGGSRGDEGGEMKNARVPPRAEERQGLHHSPCGQAYRREEAEWTRTAHHVGSPSANTAREPGGPPLTRKKERYRSDPGEKDAKWRGRKEAPTSGSGEGKV